MLNMYHTLSSISNRVLTDMVDLLVWTSNNLRTIYRNEAFLSALFFVCYQAHVSQASAFCKKCFKFVEEIGWELREPWGTILWPVEATSWLP